MKNAFDNNLKLIKYLVKFAPGLLIWKFAIMLVNIFANIVFNVVFIQYLVSSMEQSREFSEVLFSILLIAGLMIICDLLDSLFENYIQPIANKKIHKEMHNIIFDKIASIDLEKFDDPEFYNDYIWALSEVDNKTLSSFDAIINLISAVLTSISMAVIATMLDTFMLVFAIIPILLSVIFGMLSSKLNYKYAEEANIVNKKRIIQEGFSIYNNTLKK